MSCRGEDSDEHIGRYAVGVAIRNFGHSCSRRSGAFGYFGMSEPPALNDFRQRYSELRAELHFSRVSR